MDLRRRVPAGLKTSIAAAALLAVITAAGTGHAVDKRTRLLLDDGWRFHLGEERSWSQEYEGLGIGNWKWKSRGKETKPVPPSAESAGWKDAEAGEDVFGGSPGFAWFRTALPDIPGPDRRVHFAHVDDNAVVYLNGKELAGHQGWSEPFSVDLSPAWREGGPNDLSVLVENTAGPGSVGAAFLYRGQLRAKSNGPAFAGFDDSDWRRLNLPHDFVVEGKYDPTGDKSHGYLPKGVGWYRRHFGIPASDKGSRIWLEMDGVYRLSSFWLNGMFLGIHESGYTSFSLDLTDAVNFGGENVLTVRADARGSEGWWYEGGGIYRHAWLTKLNPLHAAHWGVFVTTPRVSPESATVNVKTLVQNEGATLADCALRTMIRDRKGAVVGEVESLMRISAGGSYEFDHAIQIDSPVLWSPENPHLYRAVVEVRSGMDVLDSQETPFGIRSVRFDPDHGFFLNGKPVKIKGTCNHQNFAGVGIALPDRVNEYRIEKLKEMGSNAFRCSHYPPAPEVLEACDRIGMLVMDENRHLGDSEEIIKQAEAMVMRDRNHPSVVIWSMCNEEWAQGTEQGERMGRALYDAIKRLDPTRPVTAAMNKPETWGFGLSKIVDVQGCNYGISGNADKYHREYPAHPMVVTEDSNGTTTRGEYVTNDMTAVCSSYQEAMARSWSAVAEREYISGSFIWTGFDYRGEPTPHNWPSIGSHFGVMDYCGFPKDSYYYYLAAWNEKPVVHVMPHWNWQGRGKEAGPVNVRVYGNCETVELFLNGRSLGQKEMKPNWYLSWDVTWEPGTLLAKGYREGLEAAQNKVETTGSARAVKMTPDRAVIKADGEDVSLVTVQIVDSKGRVVPTADNGVWFKLKGPGRIIGVGNGNPGSLEPDKANKRKAFHGLLMVLVQSTGTPGEIILRAHSKRLRNASVVITCAETPGRPRLP